MDFYGIPSVNQAYHFVSTCKPYKIRKALLSDGDTEKEVFVIGLRGTDGSFDKNNPLSIPVCVRAGFGKDNIFKSVVKAAMLKEIPTGSDVVFLGHSLGGMVCQHLAADEELQKNFNILNVLTFGSPYVLGKGDKCKLHRMIEKTDMIPLTLSNAFLLNCFIGKPSIESCGFLFKPYGAHCTSYEFSEKFAQYDCFGIKNGKHILHLTEEL